MADIADFGKMVGVAECAVPTVDWNALERVAGFRFPDDYRWTSETYPHLQFDRFLDIHPPGRSVGQFFGGVDVALASLRILTRSSGEMVLIDDAGQKERISPLPIFPELGGLFPWVVPRMGISVSG